MYICSCFGFVFFSVWTHHSCVWTLFITLECPWSGMSKIPLWDLGSNTYLNSTYLCKLFKFSDAYFSSRDNNTVRYWGVPQTGRGSTVSEAVVPGQPFWFFPTSYSIHREAGVGELSHLIGKRTLNLQNQLLLTFSWFDLHALFMQIFICLPDQKEPHSLYSCSERWGWGYQGGNCSWSITVTCWVTWIWRKGVERPYCSWVQAVLYDHHAPHQKLIFQCLFDSFISKDTQFKGQRAVKP